MAHGGSTGPCKELEKEEKQEKQEKPKAVRKKPKRD